MPLVVSRRLHESVLIGDSILVSIARIGSGVVRIAITAPKDIPIIRTEKLGAELHKKTFNLPGNNS